MQIDKFLRGELATDAYFLHSVTFTYKVVFLEKLINGTVVDRIIPIVPLIPFIHHSIDVAELSSIFADKTGQAPFTIRE